MSSATQTDQKFMQRAIQLAISATEHDEVPVGAVLVKNGEIIAESFNQKETNNDATDHAEMIALKMGAKVLGNWWLEDCTLYVTLEPCFMCAGAMLNARIKRLVFGAYDPKTGACGSKLNLFDKALNNHQIEVCGGVEAERCGQLLTDFFRAKRKNAGKAQ